MEQGLGRLDRWRDDGSCDIAGQELRSSDTAGVVHVALVYASLEDRPLQAGPGSAAVAQAAVSLGQYTTVLGALRLTVRGT